MAEIDGANAILGCPSPPIAIRRLAYRGNNSKNKKLKKKRKKNKKKGPSPPIAISAIGLGGEKRPLQQSPLSDCLKDRKMKLKKLYANHHVGNKHRSLETKKRSYQNKEKKKNKKKGPSPPIAI